MKRNDLLRSGIHHPARREGLDAVKHAAAGDVERFPVLTAKSAIGHFVRRHRQEVEQLATLLVDDVDATLLVLGRLERRVRLVEPGRAVPPALAILLEPIRPAAPAPVIENLAALERGGTLLFYAEAVELSGRALAT